MVTLADLAGGDAADVSRAEAGTRVRDPAVLVYTSGTTAAPKGALLSHEALVRLAAGIAERMAFTPEDRIWTAIPLFHGGGITFAVAALTARATFVHPGHFDPASTPALLEAERITVALAAFETIWLPVLDRPDWPERDLHRIRLVMAVGVPERLRAMAARVPQAVHVSCVAMTESSAFLALGRLDDPLEARLTTGGHPMPGMSVRVVDPETGADLPPDTPGELLFRGPTAFDGYFRDPEATAATIDAQGWVHTGDVVTVDADGRVTFRTRLKDMLKVGGENVSAAEIENHLLTHPAVGVVAVVAAPDARYVEVPAAFVQLGVRGVRHRRGADRALRRAHRELPGAALRALRGGVADVRHEDPQGGAPGPDRRGAGRGRDHRGAAPGEPRVTAPAGPRRPPAARGHLPGRGLREPAPARRRALAPVAAPAPDLGVPRAAAGHGPDPRRAVRDPRLPAGHRAAARHVRRPVRGAPGARRRPRGAGRRHHGPAAPLPRARRRRRGRGGARPPPGRRGPGAHRDLRLPAAAPRRARAAGRPAAGDGVEPGAHRSRSTPASR